MKKNIEISSKTKSRTPDEKKLFMTRLKTIEGQVRGVIQMIEDNRYCGDILVQISAIENSLKSVGNEILKSHLSTCVVKGIKEDDTEILDELMSLIKKIN